jgi:ABC-type polar amino acid transport system ATPase subunit
VGADAERRSLIETRPESAVVTNDLPLRANLSVLENIAIVPQYRRNMRYEAAADQAWGLLSLLGQTDAAFKRDPDLNHEERFCAKLLRAVILSPPIILIDRPGQLLPDTHYPPFLDRTLAALEGRFEQCWIVDYSWNEPLYARR